jgi:hypothetical protein
VKTAQIPPPRDPEFDRPPHPEGRKPPPDVVRFYQRLVVNPFLSALTLFLVLVASYRLGEESRAEWAPLAAIVGSIGAAMVLQYHCLDCGATGSYHRWRRHACARVVERWRTPYSAASLLFPAPGTQLVLWALATIVGSFFWFLGGL